MMDAGTDEVYGLLDFEYNATTSGDLLPERLMTVSAYARATQSPVLTCYMLLPADRASGRDVVTPPPYAPTHLVLTYATSTNAYAMSGPDIRGAYA
eukprot:3941836-Rhodomonas_salina.1